MTYLYRCNRAACRARRTLKKLATDYVRTPKCSCGGGLHRDTWQRKINKRNACWCGGVVHPHNQSHVDCVHYQGTRDLEHENMLDELGAFPVIGGGDDAPF